jgi:hypothetical protein
MRLPEPPRTRRAYALTENSTKEFPLKDLVIIYLTQAHLSSGVRVVAR